MSGEVQSPTTDRHWRTRDITVTAVIGVAFGVVFALFNIAWAPLDAVFALAPWAKDSLYAIWLVPAVLAPLIIRKPGAALFAEMVSAGVSGLLGGVWGVDALLSGLVQGGAAELIFALTAWRSYGLLTLSFAALAAAAGAWVHDWVIYYAGVSLGLQLLRGLMMGLGSILITAAGSIALVRSLRTTGVLDGFPE